jgi:hypothetical protein
MNWDAIGAMGESLSAILVLITLIYLATQVRYAKNTAADTNMNTPSTPLGILFGTKSPCLT